MRNWGVGVLVVVLGIAPDVLDGSSRSGLRVGASIATEVPGVALPSSASATVTTVPSRMDAGELHFLDPRLGWAPVVTSCGQQTCVVVFATDDGGATWTPRTDPPFAVQADEDGRVLAAPMVRLATPDIGWLVDIDGNLYATADGAKTWRAETTPHPIVSLEAIGQTVWRLEEDCPTSYGRCHYGVVTSDDGGRRWGALDPQPPIGRSGISSVRPALVRPSADVAYVFSDGGDYPAAGHSGDPPPREWNPDPVIARTVDRGRTWATLKPPCPAHGEGGAWGADLATSNPDDLWLICLDPAGSGAMQPKHLRRSSDGGQHWSEDLGTTNAGSGGRTAAGSPLRACRGGHRTSISCTRDGGRTWFFPISKANTRDGGVEVYQLVDDRHGWAIGQEDRDSGNYDVVWRTIDGGETWNPARITS